MDGKQNFQKERIGEISQVRNSLQRKNKNYQRNNRIKNGVSMEILLLIPEIYEKYKN